MSEPARHHPPQDLAGRPTPGPLRDWLAAMKAATAAQAGEIPAPIPRAVPVKPVAEKGAEPTPAWTPRVVSPPAPTETAEDHDISELMAENLMLKAKLKIEIDRYDQLQGLLAQELRRLRAHVETEMGELNAVRAERDRLTELQALFVEELDDARAQAERDADALTQVRAERDLWMARSEALAQPLFQKR